jgi:autotransporter family porin
MKKHLVYLISILIFSIFLCGSASAANINVNNSTGIQNAINTASNGDTLNLSAGTYKEHDINVNKNLTITGPAVTGNNPPTVVVDGQQLGRLFYIETGVNVTLKYLLIQNGNATDGGGGICNKGNLTVTNCSINNNTASYGGGIFNDYGNLTVTNSTLNNNNAKVVFGGGGIFTRGVCTVTNSTISGNIATEGGGILTHGFCTVINSTFTQNTATSTEAENGGGGINNYDGTCIVTNSTFIQNTAYHGGGICNPGGIFTLYNSTLIQNTATKEGGGIYNYFYSIFNVINSTISGNIASDGGGIVNLWYVNCTVTNSTITGNTATGSFGGGGIYNSNAYCIVTNSAITGNNATNGGGILNDGAYCTVTNSTLNNNIATGTDYGYGGGILNMGFCTVNNSTINNNIATEGGGIFSALGNCTVTGSTLINNQAVNGSAVYTTSSNILISFNRIFNNTGNYDVFSEVAGVNATNNWWGTNFNGADPITAGRVNSNVTATPWLYMTFTASPTLIINGKTSTLAANFNNANDGSTVTPFDPAGGHLPDGIPVIFSTTLGTINSPVATVNGTAKATLGSGTISGVADVSSTVDSQTVHTSVTIDATAPTVISTNPAQYAVNLPSNQVFTVTYSEAIKAGNLNLIVLKTSTGTVIITTKTITGNVLTITPTSALGEAKYLLLLYAGCVTDLAGNPAAALSRTYGVGAQPYVTSTDPANYAVNVARNKVITATFNEPILAKYLTLIYLKTVTGGIQVATIKSVTGNTLTITPTTPLAAGTRYMVLIYTFAVTDLAGNSNVNKQFTFTTGAT